MEIEFKNNNVEFYFSFLCPYSFLIWELLKKEFAAHPVAIKPIELSLLNKELSADSFYQYWDTTRWQKLSTYAKSLNLTIKKPTSVTDCSIATTLLCLDNDFLGQKIISAIFKAIFTDSVDISNKNLLFDFLKQNDFTDKLLNNLSYQQDPAFINTRKAELVTILKNNKIRTVPTLKISDEYFSGLLTDNILQKTIKPRLIL